MGTPKCGVTLQPTDGGDGSKDFEFVVSERSDSDYEKDPDTRHSGMGTRMLINGAVTRWRSAA